ncbi:FeS assembly protein SufD [Limosilactobacillus frumenti DSM 13145]|uniref:FeS assembly protein SufD n=1 Tax=Limosilactobacillus frumenti DSM 13145 TaxID=1423746 RepID=A0A0R1P3N3_9LACO|nr:Fe-S cluster assembly protein SufD [Limosilactobacillus frumenti]KRL27121.1 FeS assembly protein SufD [Limosilactobacillus frumenti DSM 13145]MBA2913810.1 Fe-S cluster assembly protein SufD [Limosilactobacillus frumenti]QFG72589.1 Fe-S cluster assembly protein SufD [Limosilactobacillus frumenti]
MNEQELKQISQAHNEPAALWDIRQKAFQLIAKTKLPTMQRFSYQDWPLTTENDLSWLPPKPSNIQPTQFTLLGQMVINHTFPEEWQAKGVRVMDMFQAWHDDPTTMTKYFAKVIKPSESKLTAFHYAYMNSGLIIKVPRNMELKAPLELNLIQDNRIDGGLNSHVLVIAGQNSSCSILQHWSSLGKQVNTLNSMVEVIAEPGSHVNFSALDEIGVSSTVTFNRRALIKRDAEVNWAVGMMNDCNTVGDIDAELVGDGSQAHSNMIGVTGHQQHVGINNRVTNRGKHTLGLINQRGVINDQSELIFNGIGQIIHGAHGSQADQQNRVLVMSEQARGDANPILLIDENDVEAGHAASVGPVDPHQMYYLMSRGIPRKLAEQMVIRGFLGPVLDNIPSANVRQHMINILERKLKNE